jgi:hypothetical protein
VLFCPPLPKHTRAAKDAARGKLAKMRGEDIAEFLAGLTSEALAAGRIPSKFAYEALFRASLRSALCLQGWGWADADQAAAGVVQASLRKLKAERPSWNEGQPEWTIEGGTLIERTRCIRCHNPLPEGHFKFCSALCKGGHHARLHWLRQANEGQISKTVARHA